MNHTNPLSSRVGHLAAVALAALTAVLVTLMLAAAADARPPVDGDGGGEGGGGSVPVQTAITKSQYNDLGWERFMNTDVTVSPTVGRIDGTTRIWTTAPWTGFHGGVYARFHDAGGEIIGTSAPNVYGVDGKYIPFLASDRTQGWSESLNSTLLGRIKGVSIVHTTETGANLRSYLIQRRDEICRDYWAKAFPQLPCPLNLL